ncbi:MAG: PIN domain-containing protein [Actinomycetota bacterium]
MIIVDTGVLLAYFIATDPDHVTAREFLETTREPLTTTPLVIAEVDYFVLERFGPDHEARVIEHLMEGPLALAEFGERELIACSRLLGRYQDLELGLTDASVMVAAESLGTRKIATFDERDFRAVTTEAGLAFDLLPQG